MSYFSESVIINGKGLLFWCGNESW